MQEGFLCSVKAVQYSINCVYLVEVPQIIAVVYSATMSTLLEEVAVTKVVIPVRILIQILLKLLRAPKRQEY